MRLLGEYGGHAECTGSVGVGRHVNRSLDTHISRAITNNIVPLIPANSDLRYLLYEITENQWERYGKLILALARF